jgi:hypothetical protein
MMKAEELDREVQKTPSVRHTVSLLVRTFMVQAAGDQDR